MTDLSTKNWQHSGLCGKTRVYPCSQLSIKEEEHLRPHWKLGFADRERHFKVRDAPLRRNALWYSLVASFGFNGPEPLRVG